MKTKRILFLIPLVISMFLGCAEHEDSNTLNSLAQESSLKGEWNMMKLQGGFAGVSNSFAYGDVVWAFNDNDLTLTVNNSIDSQNIISGLSSGVYNYSVENNGVESYLIIENVNFGKYSISLEGLTLDQNLNGEDANVSDGMVLFFEK